MDVWPALMSLACQRERPPKLRKQAELMKASKKMRDLLEKTPMFWPGYFLASLSSPASPHQCCRNSSWKISNPKVMMKPHPMIMKTM